MVDTSWLDIPLHAAGAMDVWLIKTDAFGNALATPTP